MTTKTKDKCVGLIGLGYWGKNILRNLYEMGALRRACDSSAEVVEARRAQFSDADYCGSFADLLGSDDIRAVAVATPAATHYDVVKAALLAGKDVFVEKPLALTVRQGEELAGLAEERKRVLMVGHILQYHPAVRKLKEMVGRGDLGKIQYVYSNRLNIGMLRTEENILWSFAPHDISVILGLLGDEPVSVDAFGGCYLNEGIFDTTMTALEFRNGVRAHIFVSWLHPYKEQKLILVGSKAMAVFDDVSKEKLFVYPHSIEWKEGRIPVAQKAAYEVVAIDGGEPLRLQMEHFLECVETRQRPRTDGREGLRVLRTLDMAETALRRKRPAPAAAHVSEPGGPQVHETACVDDGVVLGPGVKVWHFSHILRGSRVGRGSIIGQNVVIGPDVTVGDRCKVQNNVSLYKGVTLEDEVFCGPSCVFTNVYNPRAFIERKHEFLPTLVKRGATIGANATIVCGVTIGRYAMVGAGAVVKGDVADYAIVAGVPARQIGWACRCGTTLAFGNGDALCTYCGNRYALREGTFQAVTERD